MKNAHLDKVIHNEPNPEFLPIKYLERIRIEALKGHVRLGYAFDVLHIIERRKGGV